MKQPLKHGGGGVSGVEVRQVRSFKALLSNKRESDEDHEYERPNLVVLNGWRSWKVVLWGSCLF